MAAAILLLAFPDPGEVGNGLSAISHGAPKTGALLLAADLRLLPLVCLTLLALARSVRPEIVSWIVLLQMVITAAAVLEFEPLGGSWAANAIWHSLGGSSLVGVTLHFGSTVFDVVLAMACLSLAWVPSTPWSQTVNAFRRATLVLGVGVVAVFMLFVNLGGVVYGVPHPASFQMILVWSGPFIIFWLIPRTRTATLVLALLLLPATVLALVTLFRDQHSTAGLRHLFWPQYLYAGTGLIVGADRVAALRRWRAPSNASDLSLTT